MPGQNPAVPEQQPMSPEPGGDEFAQLFGDLLDGVQPTLEGFAHDGLAHDGLAHDGLAHDGLAHDGLAHDGLEHDETEAECGVSSTRDVASLEGYGPISDADAIEIASQADCWECVTVDTVTGNVLTVDTYRPSAAQRRYLGARDLHCRFPGCRASLAWCDIDHTIDAAMGGPTSSDNLGYLCRRHHTLKHASPWTVTQDQAGVYTWVSPTGRTYVDRPESNVRFRAVSDAEGTALPSAAVSSAAKAGGKRVRGRLQGQRQDQDQGRDQDQSPTPWAPVSHRQGVWPEVVPEIAPSTIRFDGRTGWRPAGE